MSVNILYFASLREAIGQGAERLELPAGIGSVGALRDHLAGIDVSHAALVATKNLRAAVNQKMVGLDAPVVDGDEVAFFPPVTGG